MEIRCAEKNDIDLLAEYDQHISKEELESSIHLRRVYIAEENGGFAGWLRYNLFWDNTPFMNLLYILEQYRGKGVGRQMVFFWENEMGRQGFKTLLTSTQSDEYAQHFYFKLGYEAIGGFCMEGGCYEVVLKKNR